MVNQGPPSEQPDTRGQAVYMAMRENAGRVMQIQGEIGKWLIASVALLHTGALVVLLQNEHVMPALIAGAAWWFVFGIILIFLCGFLTWINTTLNVKAYEHYADVNLLMNDFTILKTKYPKSHWIGITHVAAIISGLGSMCMLILGTYSIYSSISS